MDRDLVHGMFWAGVLLSSIPLSLGIAAGVYALRQLRKSDGTTPEHGVAEPAEPVSGP